MESPDTPRGLESFTQCDWINLKGPLGDAGALNLVLRLFHTYLGQTGEQSATHDFAQDTTGKKRDTIPGVQADEQCLTPAHSGSVDMKALIRRENLVVACDDGRPNVCSGKGQKASAGELAQVVLPKL